MAHVSGRILRSHLVLGREVRNVLFEQRGIEQTPEAPAPIPFNGEGTDPACLQPDEKSEKQMVSFSAP
jgi:hypothetical protein